jgi:D-proline reductase (dithiol) PrdB
VAAQRVHCASNFRRYTAKAKPVFSQDLDFLARLVGDHRRLKFTDLLTSVYQLSIAGLNQFISAGGSFQQDWNVILPLDRLRELDNEVVIGALARYHYSFMGAASIQKLAPRARELAALLRRDEVNAVLLLPV